MMNARPIYPFPEAVDPRGGKPWAIEPSSAFTPRVYTKRRVLQVPLDDSEHSRFLRDHELGHIKWSHPKPDQVVLRHKIAFDVLQAVEDARVNTKLYELGVDVSGGPWPRRVATAVAANLLRQGDPRSIILTMVAAQGTGDNEEHFRRVFNTHPVGTQAVRVAKEARQSLWASGSPKFKDTIRVAKWLQLLLDGITPHGTLPKSSGSGMGAGGLEGLEEGLKIIGQHGTSARMTKKVPWGKMRIETPPRPIRVTGYLGRRRIAAEEGSVPRNVHRLLVDGRVFQRTRRQRGGSVLIDASGSMSLTNEDLKKILEHAPGARVAVYSGNDRDGVLRVLAADGRQVEDHWVAAPAGGCNVVDGPALTWLSTQQKPRVWVSDGQVTGVHDRMSAINSLECAALCRRCRVARYEDTRTMLKRLGYL
jgi:hypothetical protein